jgi:phosphatidylserine/phosphatidylglycerophosphate/cardiolipin synthase-like enzyme
VDSGFREDCRDIALRRKQSLRQLCTDSSQCRRSVASGRSEYINDSLALKPPDILQRDYFWNLSRAISLAKDTIYIHDWWLSPGLLSYYFHHHRDPDRLATVVRAANASTRQTTVSFGSLARTQSEGRRQDFHYTLVRIAHTLRYLSLKCPTA